MVSPLVRQANERNDLSSLRLTVKTNMIRNVWVSLNYNTV